MTNENIINGFDFGSLPINITYCGKIIEGKKGWDHFLYSVNIGTGENMFTTQYKCGMAHVELKKKGTYWPMPNPPHRKGTLAYDLWAEQAYQPKKPSNSDIMYALLMDSEANDYSFSDWCDCFGYDSDSITALNIYQACENIGKNLRKVFTAEQIQQMRKALEDY